MSLVLASRSAARRAMLTAAGLQIETDPADVDEAATKARLAGAAPRDVAMVLAEEKALEVSRRRSGLVLGADQTLELDGAVLDKATSLEDARSKLKALSGRTHQLHSAAVLAENGEPVWRRLDSAELSVRPLANGFIDAYLARNPEAALTSAGGYWLEGEGAQLFEAVRGDYFTVLGLPLLPLLAALRERGMLSA